MLYVVLSTCPLLPSSSHPLIFPSVIPISAPGDVNSLFSPIYSFSAKRKNWKGEALERK